VLREGCHQKWITVKYARKMMDTLNLEKFQSLFLGLLTSYVMVLEKKFTEWHVILSEIITFLKS